MVAPVVKSSIDKSRDVVLRRAPCSNRTWCQHDIKRGGVRKLVSSCLFRGARYGSALLMTVILFGLGVSDSSASSVFTLRGKVQEGVNLSNPHRTAIGIVCSEQTLRPGMPNTELGLEAPSEYHGTYVESVAVKVESKKRAMIVISYKEIGSVVRRGDIIVYFGTCGPSGTTWEIGGTLPKPYWPRQ